MPKFSVSIAMRGTSAATRAMFVHANTPEQAYELTASNVELIYSAANRPEPAEFAVSVCDCEDEDFTIHHFQNFEGV